MSFITSSPMQPPADPVALTYHNTRITHWNSIATRTGKATAYSAFYQQYLHKIYRFLVPEGLRILEIGCGTGNLLAALCPSYGLGVDFSDGMLKHASTAHPHLHFLQADAHNLEALHTAGMADTPFDIIVLSDIINDVWDVQILLEAVRPFCTETTRIIINFHSQLWEHPFLLAQKLGKVTPHLTQNWFTPDDIDNLLTLTGFETINSFDDLLWPRKTPVLSTLCNRYLAKIWPFKILDFIHVMVARPLMAPKAPQSVSVIIPARNEAGNIEAALQRTPDMGAGTEIIFVEGNSTDATWATIQKMAAQYSHRTIKVMQQTGKGKGDAVRKGFSEATGDILMILDADLTMPPEKLPQFYDAIATGKAEFVNGVRLVYPQEKEAMRFCNLLGNKFFSVAFSWLLGRSIKDTLCGTKVMSRQHYENIARNRHYFGEFDPFGDFDLIFGAAKLNLKIRDLPVRYRERVYGDTNIDRWKAGWILLQMVLFAARRIKFI